MTVHSETPLLLKCNKRLDEKSITRLTPRNTGNVYGGTGITRNKHGNCRRDKQQFTYYEGTGNALCILFYPLAPEFSLKC